MVAFFSMPRTIHAQNENPTNTKEVLCPHTSHIRQMPQEQCKFRVAHIHIMANYFIATNAAIDITFTLARSSVRFSFSIFVSLIVSGRLLFCHNNKTDGHFYRIRTKTEKSPEFICSDVTFALYNKTINVFVIAIHAVNIHTWLPQKRIICSNVPFVCERNSFFDNTTTKKN